MALSSVENPVALESLRETVLPASVSRKAPAFFKALFNSVTLKLEMLPLKFP